MGSALVGNCGSSLLCRCTSEGMTFITRGVNELKGGNRQGKNMVSGERLNRI